jgi:hypothetical protein
MAGPPVNPSTPTSVFIDTNVLLYAASDGRQDPGKKRLAGHLQLYDTVLVVKPFAQAGRWIHEDPLPLRGLR